MNPPTGPVSADTSSFVLSFTFNAVSDSAEATSAEVYDAVVIWGLPYVFLPDLSNSADGWHAHVEPPSDRWPARALPVEPGDALHAATPPGWFVGSLSFTS
jgi:hypothetical protein